MERDPKCRKEDAPPHLAKSLGFIVFPLGLKMEVGTVSKKVLVKGQAEAVETVNPTIGQSVTNRLIIVQIAPRLTF